MPQPSILEFSFYISSNTEKDTEMGKPTEMIDIFHLCFRRSISRNPLFYRIIIDNVSIYRYICI